MPNSQTKNVSTAMVVLAFATVYIVWGSTYFFIQRAIETMPALIMGAFRFITAGLLLMAYCAFRGEKIFDRAQMKSAAISGLLMLFVGNGAVVWAEKSLPSSLVAVLVSAAPIWFVALDKRNWKANFSSRSTIIGLIVGFLGVFLLFSEQTVKALTAGNSLQVFGLVILIIGSISWAAGSLYSKYKSSGSGITSTAWQMLAAGLAFLPGSVITNEWSGFAWSQVSTGSWLATLYLVFFGSLAGYSAYVWLLQVRPVTQVSTYAYVNPVVAVLLGVLFAGEHMTWIQITGLAIILASVLLINLAKYRQQMIRENSQHRSALSRLLFVPKAKAEV
jgi:Permeases of the drug/metabolite transporter (DMT) superfamily